MNLPMFVTAIAACIAAWKGVANSHTLNQVKEHTNGMQAAMMKTAHTQGMSDQRAATAALSPQERHEEIRGQGKGGGASEPGADR